MAFLVIFNSDGAPIQENLRLSRDAMIVERPARSREIALAWSADDGNLDANRVRHASLQDGGLRLIGRIRSDKRDALAAQLGAPASETDAELYLRAYARWGERCVDHLRGDFCFVIWDEPCRRLFCARDQIGVRPLFHARTKDRWIIGDSLDIVARVSGLDAELDDIWIADFLLEPFCRAFDRTVYRRIKRLPPAHTLTAVRDSVLLQKYWSLEIDAPIHFRKSQDYLDCFHELLARAIKERLPAGRVGVTMSGGLDSTTLAAKAVEITGDPSRVVAFTSHFERLIPDDEAYYSSLVAKRLGIAQKFLAMDEVCEDHAEAPFIWSAEPGGPTGNAPARQLIETEMAGVARVWLFGEGPDNALTFEWLSHLRWLANRGDWFFFLKAVVQYLGGKNGRDWLLTVKRLNAPRHRRAGADSPDLPAWISRDFADRAGLIERRAPKSVHHSSWRPGALASFSSPIWQRLFEHIDPSTSGCMIDYRHPYLDLDVLTFMLRTPPIPWARGKRLIREAMRGRLPDEVLSREKTPLAVDPLAIVAHNRRQPPLTGLAALSNYVNIERLPSDDTANVSAGPLAKLRMLGAWLEGRPA